MLSKSARLLCAQAVAASVTQLRSDQHNSPFTSIADNGNYNGDVVIVNGEGKRHGKGKMVYKQGADIHAVYEGQWVEGKRNGQGQMTFFKEFKDTTVHTIVGNWVDNLPVGKVVLTWSNGDKYDDVYFNNLERICARARVFAKTSAQTQPFRRVAI